MTRQRTKTFLALLLVETVPVISPPPLRWLSSLSKPFLDPLFACIERDSPHHTCALHTCRPAPRVAISTTPSTSPTLPPGSSSRRRQRAPPVVPAAQQEEEEEEEEASWPNFAEITTTTSSSSKLRPPPLPVVRRRRSCRRHLPLHCRRRLWDPSSSLTRVRRQRRRRQRQARLEEEGSRT